MMKTRHCVICDINEEVETLVSGATYSLCKQCLGLIVFHMLARTQHNVERPASWSRDMHWYCSGCGKRDDEAHILVELNNASHDCLCSKCIIDCIADLLPSVSKAGTPIRLQMNGKHAE